MNEIESRIIEAFKGNKQFDEDVRHAMHRALQLDEHKNKEAPASQAHMAISLLAIEVAVSLANAFASLRRPSEARTVRLQFDLVVGLNSNAFWGQHAASIMPLWHTILMDHLDSVSMQIERGETKISPWDKLIMGAEASVLAPFSQILFLVGGSALQMAGSVALKKELMPLLMK
jgi:hypothetical protein